MAEPDDEISEAETLDRARLISKTHLWELAINGVTVVLSIASTGVPLYVVYLMMSVLAGKHTTISAAISYSGAGLVGASTGTAVVAGGLGKYRSQRKELVRLRDRCVKLEDRLKRKGRR